MINETKSKKIVFFIIIIILALTFYTKINNMMRKEELLEVKLPKSELTINNIEVNDNAILLYNVIYLPMNSTFSKLFGDNYIKDENQTIKYNDIEIKIDNTNNIITLPNINVVDENNKFDNSVDVEIEIYNNNKYVPIYLISNLPKILVTVNGKNIYTDSNYKNSLDVYKKDKENEIIIYKLDNKTKETKEDKYFGQEDGALWREEALKRIEKYRKKNISVNIVNQNKNEIENAKISLKMNKSSFKFGTAVRYFEKKEKNNYDDINNNLFNTIGTENGLKWFYTNEYNFNIVKDIITYAKLNKMSVRGHLLFADYNFGQFDNFISNNSKEDSLKEIYEQYKNNVITYKEAENRMNKLQEKFESTVEAEIEDYVTKLKEIYEWDVINSPDLNQYYKYYLFEKKALKDSDFINNSRLTGVKYINNENYNKFMAKCFDKARESNKNANLLINFNRVNGNEYSKTLATTITNNVKKYTDNIDSIGVQYHVMNYNSSPTSYYNSINYILKNTGIKKAKITEFDNRNDIKDKDTRSKYLRDTLISLYSNKNIDEFYMWVYNSDTYFTKEERETYSKTVNKWLNYNESEISTDGKYITSLYKGTYEATITLPNGKSQIVNFDVSDDSSDTIEVVFDSNLQNISIKEEPKTEYYKNEKIDLTKGSIIANYDDGTSKEIKLTDNDIKILNFDTIDNGKKTLTIQYNGCNTSYDINVKENIKEDVNKIINENNIIKNKYDLIYKNENVEKQYNNLLNYLNSTSQNQDENSLELLNKIYIEQLNLARAIVNEYNKNNITIKSTDYEEIIKQIIDISDDYKDLYKLYISEDNLSNKEAEDKINNVINRYNDNTDIDLSKETDLINKLKELYGSLSSNDDITLNYLNKQRISKTCEIFSLMLENDIKNVANSECRKITITSDSGLGNYTNHDETITVNLPKKAKVTSDNGASSFIFTENGTKEIKINDRGYDYTYKIVVSNIDKQAPKINTDGGQDVKIDISEDNLKEIKIEKDGKETKAKIGQVISVPGIYKITATDKAENSSNKEIIVYKNYTNEQNSQIKYITIKSKTKVKDVRENTNYSITKNSKIIAALKSTNSNSNNIDDSYISTGDVLKDGDNEYTFVVIGDLSGNGQVVASDVIRLRKNIVGITDLSKLQELAADTNLDGKVDILDLVKERKIMVEEE